MRSVFVYSKKMTLIVLSGIAAIAGASAHAGAKATVDPNVTRNASVTYQESGVPFLDEKERGWHWYENPEPEPEEEMPEPPAPPAPPAPPPPPPGPAPLSSEWLKENMPKFLNRAIDEPTHENVAAYLYLQRLALKKADKYSEVVKVVTVKEPWLDANAEQPVSNAGADTGTKMGVEMRTHLLKKLSKDTGILFFFRSDCKYCHLQWPILQMFAKETGFSVMPVTMDGGLLPGMDPSTVQMDQGQSQMFGVQVTPTLFLFQPKTRNTIPISNGMITLDELPQAIVRMSTDAGLIREKDFTMTRGYLTVGSPKATPATPETMMKDARPDDVADSTSLYKYMKGKLKDHGQR
jgi:conjugal transfer pilus assembly protein TraF